MGFYFDAFLWFCWWVWRNGVSLRYGSIVSCMVPEKKEEKEKRNWRIGCLFFYCFFSHCFLSSQAEGNWNSCIYLFSKCFRSITISLYQLQNRNKLTPKNWDGSICLMDGIWLGNTEMIMRSEYWWGDLLLWKCLLINSQPPIRLDLSRIKAFALSPQIPSIFPNSNLATSDASSHNWLFSLLWCLCDSGLTGTKHFYIIFGPK